MIYSIKRDHARFRSIIKGKIKRDLKKYITHGEMIARKGKDLVTIPLPQIDIPHFRYGDKQQGGVGQGDGKPGDPIGQGDPQAGDTSAGSQPGEHALEVELTLQELAEILGEELELPKIEPRGPKTIKSRSDRYTTIASRGPEALRSFKRTYREAIKRQIAAGQYNQEHPIVIPIRKDMRYRSWKTDVRHENSAVIIYIMDVSGSMGDEQKGLKHATSFTMRQPAKWTRILFSGPASQVEH